MLNVPTQLKPSEIHGIGLFASEDIEAGTVVWTFDLIVDRRISRNRVERLPDLARETIMRYCYINPDDEFSVVLCGDDARFMNFDEHPNTRTGDPVINGEHSLIADCFIAEGEEITVPFDSDADARRKLSSFKTKMQKWYEQPVSS